MALNYIIFTLQEIAGYGRNENNHTLGVSLFDFGLRPKSFHSKEI